MKQLSLILFNLVLLHVAFSQNATTLFTEEAFIQIVRDFHPVAKQAKIVVQKAEAELLAAKGNFDPTVQADLSRKTFDKKNYYNYWNPEVKVPTWFGADMKAGLESNGGLFVNDEFTVGNSSYLGIEMPLLRNLLMDKRRAAVKQANIFRSQSEQERLIILNDLLFDAYVSYYQWAGTFQLLNIYNRFIKISTDRLRLVRIAWQNGDRSVMDTVEAWTQLQSFRIRQTEAQMKLTTARLDLSTYLWVNEDTAYLMPETFYPDTTAFAGYTDLQPLENYISRALNESPAIRTYTFKLDALEVERKLKQQSLLPYLNLKYNLLNQDYFVLKDFGNNLLQNNYKWGIDFKVPIFLREGRGDYRKAKLKIQETNYAFDNKKWQVITKTRNYYNETLQYQNQLQQNENLLRGFSTLLRNEELRFTYGESSMFLVNSRENKVMETAEKMTELRIKYFKSKYAIQWAAGLLR